MKKATRAMYPLSSSSDRKKNSVTMIGRKLSTLPTPWKMPSITRSWIVWFTFAAVSAWSTSTVSASMPCSSRPCSHAPITLNVSQNTSPMMAMKAGMAVYLPVRKRSIFRERSVSRLSCGLRTAAAQTRPMKSKRMSAMAALRSSFRSVSIWRMMWSSISCSFSSSCSCRSTRSSPSMSLLAAKRTGRPYRSA